MQRCGCTDVMWVALFCRYPVTVRHRCVGSWTGYVDKGDDFRLIGGQSRVRLTSSNKCVCVVFASSVLGNGVSGLIRLGCVDGVATLPRRH